MTQLNYHFRKESQLKIGFCLKLYKRFTVLYDSHSLDRSIIKMAARWYSDWEKNFRASNPIPIDHFFKIMINQINHTTSSIIWVCLSICLVSDLLQNFSREMAKKIKTALKLGVKSMDSEPYGAFFSTFKPTTRSSASFGSQFRRYITEIQDVILKRTRRT